MQLINDYAMKNNFIRELNIYDVGQIIRMINLTGSTCDVNRFLDHGSSRLLPSVGPLNLRAGLEQGV